MDPTTKKRKRPTKDAAVVSTEDESPTCTYIDHINGDKTIIIKVPGNKDTRASSSMNKEPVTRRAQAVKSKAAATSRKPRSNKAQLPPVSELRTPITRSKKWQGHEQDLPIVRVARKWSNNNELRILRGLPEHGELHEIDWAALYDKITRDGNFDNLDAGILQFRDKAYKLRSLYRKMLHMKDPKGDDHKIELFRIASNLWGDLASNAHAHGVDVDSGIDADASDAHNNSHAHALTAALGAHAGVVASPDVPPAPAAPLDAHAVMDASPDDSPAPASPLVAHAGTGASPDAPGVPANVGMPLPVKRAKSFPGALAAASPAALARASPAAPARASPAAPAHPMLLPSGTTTTFSCASSRDEDRPSQWLHVVLKWGSRVAFLTAFAAFMSPGWRKGGDTRSSRS